MEPANDKISTASDMLKAVSNKNSINNSLNVPIVPQWNNNNNTCVTTPDGGFLYVGSRTINYISYASSKDVPPQIKIFHARQNLLGVDVDPAWSPNENELDTRNFAILAEDNSLHIWQFNKNTPTMGHRAHIPAGRYIDGCATRQSVLFAYMRNSNILSLDSQDIVIYCNVSNSYCKLPCFLPTRNQKLKILSTSPFDEHLFAVGTTRGVVLICDLQRQAILYTLRGHDTHITALSWSCACANATHAVDCAETKKTVKFLKKALAIDLSNEEHAVQQPAVLQHAAEEDELFDIYDFDYLEQEFGAPTTKVEQVASFVGVEKPNTFVQCEQFDFVEACQNLKAQIEEDHTNDNDADNAYSKCNITLSECQEAAANKRAPDSADDEYDDNDNDDDDDDDGDDEIEEEESGHSFDKRTNSTLSDNSLTVDGTNKNCNRQILLQADVHATNKNDEPEEGKKVEKPEDEKKIVEEKNVVQIAEEKNEKEMEILTEELKLEKEEKMQADTTEDAVNVTKNENITAVETESHKFLLVSASIDGYVWVWDSKTGRTCDSMRLRTGNHHQQGKNSHIHVSCYGNNGFLASNRHGDVAQWQLDNVILSEEKTFQFKENREFLMQDAVVDFAVCSNKNIVWCISARREILCKSLDSGLFIARYSCLPTNIAALSECPYNLNHIALACSDRRIGIIDTSNITPTSISIKNYTQRIASVVTALTWSPDGLKLAFATAEGRVGVLNTEKAQDTPFIFHPVCGSRIYSMTWQEKGIYVVCNHVLACYDVALSKKDADIISEAKEATCVSVVDKHIFVGTQRGNVEVFVRKEGKVYILLQTVQCAKRFITQLDWSQVEKSHLAVVSNNQELNVYKFDNTAKKLELLLKIEIKGNKFGCAAVKWSHLNGNLLVTAGLDGAVRVFDISQESMLKYLKQYDCPMLCAMFMPTNEDILMCAGKATSLEFIDMKNEATEDYSIARWKQANRAKLNVQYAVKMMPAKPARTRSTAAKQRQTRDTLAETSEQKQKLDVKKEKNESNVIDENITVMMGNLTVETKQKSVTDIESKEQTVLYEKNPSTLLCLTTKDLNKNAVVKLLSILNFPKHVKKTHGSNETNSIVAKLFGSQQQAKELWNEEMKNLETKESMKELSNLFAVHLSTNGLKTEILKCIQNRTLNEVHVSMAPSVSYQFWQKCCTAFAAQLEEQGFVLRAATFLLARHDQGAVIDLLLRNNYYSEALLVARLYLQTDAPEISTIVNKWIEYLVNTGNIPAAALICTLDEQINRAHTILENMRNINAEIEKVIELLKTHKKFKAE